jgi:hypothetical protein
VLAGHVRHYRSFVEDGGLVPLLGEAGLRVQERLPLTKRLTLWKAAEA